MFCFKKSPAHLSTSVPATAVRWTWDIPAFGDPTWHALAWPVYTPPKTNMEPQNWWFVDVSPLSRGYFQVPCLFSGVYIMNGVAVGENHLVICDRLWTTICRNCTCLPVYDWGERTLHAHSSLLRRQSLSKCPSGTEPRGQPSPAHPF